MSTRSKRVTPEQAEDAAAAVASLDKVGQLRPRWQDYVDEGVIDSVPEPGPDGEPRASVQGHDKVVRMLQMNEAANNLSAWRADNLRDAPERRSRNEARAERKARKFHRPRVSITVPDLPWKRDR